MHFTLPRAIYLPLFTHIFLSSFLIPHTWLLHNATPSNMYSASKVFHVHFTPAAHMSLLPLPVFTHLFSHHAPACSTVLQMWSQCWHKPRLFQRQQIIEEGSIFYEPLSFSLTHPWPTHTVHAFYMSSHLYETMSSGIRNKWREYAHTFIADFDISLINNAPRVCRAPGKRNAIIPLDTLRGTWNNSFVRACMEGSNTCVNKYMRWRTTRVLKRESNRGQGKTYSTI